MAIKLPLWNLQIDISILRQWAFPIKLNNNAIESFQNFVDKFDNEEMKNGTGAFRKMHFEIFNDEKSITR